MSKETNINMDHYKTRGRASQGDGVAHETHKRVLSASQLGSQNPAGAIRSGNTGLAIPSSSLRRLQRLRRRRRVKGLSARQLLERKNSPTWTKHVNQGVRSAL